MRIKIDDTRLLPTKTNSTDAGFDLRTPVEINLPPGKGVKIDTGVSMAIPIGYMGLVVPRSGLGIRGLNLKNTAGVIDSTYRGNIIVNVENTSSDNFIEVEKFGRFAQIIIVPILLTDITVVDKLGETVRGNLGFGSSGVK